MNKEYNEESKTQNTESGEDSEYAYKRVIRKNEQRRTWSVISVALAALSIVLIYFSWVSLVLGLASVGAAVIFRLKLGYFDKLSLTALIIAIFGVVFSITGIAFGDVIASLFA